MNEVVLVTGSESLTGRKLIEKLLARSCRVLAPVAGKGTETSDTGTKNLTVLVWNKASWFSAKTVIREALKIHNRIDAAWIIHHSPAGDLPPFSQAGSSTIEGIWEQGIKGSIALVRELLPHLESSLGFLGMVIPYGGGRSGNPIQALAQGAFTGFSGEIIKDTRPQLWACAMNSTSSDAEGFSSALIKLWETKPPKLRGRWFRHSDGRRLPFTSFSNSIR